MNSIVKYMVSFVAMIAIFICSTAVYVSAEDSGDTYVPHGVLTLSEYIEKREYYEKFNYGGNLEITDFSIDVLHGKLSSHNSVVRHAI